MRLILPSIKYKKEYLKALKEGLKETQETRLDQPKKNQSFNDFIKTLREKSQGINLPQGYVPATTLWLIDKNKFIGKVSIRHKLNKKLLNHGGHIGYYVRPSKRRMGYGSKILKLSLKKASKIGISKVLLTCDQDNLASKKIIEKNQGILKKEVSGECHYWINLRS
jgi:predicted acetyltransferase